MSRLFRVFTVVTAVCLVTACGIGNGTLTSPSSEIIAPRSLTAPILGSGVGSIIQTHGEQLTAVIGTGAGTVNVTPTAAVEGSFSAQIEVNVHGAPPATTFYVQRAPEIGRADSADGICQRAADAPPWGPPTPNFVTFPLPAAGPLVTLTTSPGGSGAVHLDFDAPTIADGTQFDVMFRLVDSLTVPANDLRTGCFTVTVK